MTFCPFIHFFAMCFFFCPVHIFVLFIFSSCIPVLHEQTLYQIYAVRKSSRTNWKLYTRGKPLIYGAWLSCTYFLVYIFFCLIIFPSSTYFRSVHIIVLYKYYISTHIVANCRIRQYRMYCNRHQTNF